MSRLRSALRAVMALAAVSLAACGGTTAPMPSSPTPMPPVSTANAYILPGAVSQNNWAFGDEPVVIYKNERLRWINADTLTHLIVADMPEATDFHQTGELRAGGGEESFVMTRVGTTTIHCAIHANMTGTLIVRER